MCLGQEDVADLRAPLRNHPEDDAPLKDPSARRST